jgi:hypothetical protein
MTNKSFNMTARNHYLELLAEFVEETMKNFGYDKQMELNRPDNPDIWEFAKKDQIITMTITPVGGNLTDQSSIKIESESEDAQETICEIVGTAVGNILGHYSKKVFECIESKKGKLTVLNIINNKIEEIKKEL